MKKFTLTRWIATIGCFIAAMALSVFLFLASDRTEDALVDVVTAENDRFITPKTMGSYGELMFAYIGEHNYLYNLDDESEPLVRQPAKELLYASDDSVLYLTSCELSDDHAGRESSIKELMVGENGNQLNTIATVTVDPCWSSNDEVIYFVKDDEPTVLYTFEPLTSTTEVTAHFDEEIVALRISSDGLLITLESAVEKLFVPLSKQLTDTTFNAQGMRITVCEQYDLLQQPDGVLLYRWQGANEAVQISENCIAAISHQDNEIYYIDRNEDGASLNAYIVSEEEHQRLVELDDTVLPQLTADADYAFVLDEQGIVYRYDIQDGNIVPYHFIDMEVVRSPLISLFDYRLMVYDLSAEPDASFCYAISAVDEASEEEQESNTNRAEEIHAQNSDRLQYPEKAYLSMGAIGEDVRLYQEKLLEAGYIQNAPSGFYGITTMEATLQAQHDMGMEETGCANRILQEMIGEADEAIVYQELVKGDSGYYTSAFQARLRTLGYMKAPISGVMDDATLEAARRFCQQNGYEMEDEVVSAEIVMNVHAANAETCSMNLPLTLSDECDQAYRLNTRLWKLGYLAGFPAAEVNEKTMTAVILFCEVNGNATVNKVITEAVQDAIFADNAENCPEEFAPVSADDAQSSVEGQVITDKELKILRKWLTKSFAVNHTDRQAVKRLQMRLVRMGYLEKDAVSMVYDETTAAAIRNFQQANGLTADGIPNKKTLMTVFKIDNGQLSGE